MSVVAEAVGWVTLFLMGFALGRALYDAVKAGRRRRPRSYLMEYHGDALPRIDPEEWPVERFN